MISLAQICNTRVREYRDNFRELYNIIRHRLSLAIGLHAIGWRATTEAMEGSFKGTNVAKAHLAGDLTDCEIPCLQQPSRLRHSDDPDPVREADIDLGAKERREVFVFAADHSSCIAYR